MTDSLRDRVAKVIWTVFQNTPPIDATDDEWESWWSDSTQEEKALCYAQADAVIAELGLKRASRPNDYGYVQYPAGDRYITGWMPDA